MLGTHQARVVFAALRAAVHHDPPRPHFVSVPLRQPRVGVGTGLERNALVLHRPHRAGLARDKAERLGPDVMRPARADVPGEELARETDAQPVRKVERVHVPPVKSEIRRAFPRERGALLHPDFGLPGYTGNAGMKGDGDIGFRGAVLQDESTVTGVPLVGNAHALLPGSHRGGERRGLVALDPPQVRPTTEHRSATCGVVREGQQRPCAAVEPQLVTVRFKPQGVPLDSEAGGGSRKNGKRE